MRLPRALTIDFFAQNYLAQVILGVFVALALQQAIDTIFSVGKFRAEHIRFAIEHTLDKEYSKYPIFKISKTISIKEINNINAVDDNRVFNTINEAINSLPVININPVIILRDNELSKWSDGQLRAFAQKINNFSQSRAFAKNTVQAVSIKLINKDTAVELTKNNGERITLKLIDINQARTSYQIERDIINYVNDFNQFYQPTQELIKNNVSKLLKKQQILRNIAVLILLLFLIIQPWHLYKELQRFSNISNNLSNRVLLILAFIFVGIIITYGAMNWGDAFIRTPIYGICVFMLLWCLFDGIKIWSRVRFSKQKKKNYISYIQGELKKSRDIRWLIVDILFLLIAFFLIKYQFLRLDSYESLTIFRISEIIFLLSLTTLNILMFIGISNDDYSKYVSSLENFAILSEEDNIDAKIVFQELKKLNKEIAWLDIGSGNLHKVQLILEFSESADLSFKAIDCLEPRSTWGQCQSCKNSPFPIEVYSQKWPDFIKDGFPRNSWSLITLIHSLYQSEIVENGLVNDMLSIYNYLSLPGCVIIITEGPQSSLLKAKRLVYNELGGTLITENEIQITADRLNWPSPKRIELNQKFYIDAKNLVQSDNDESLFPWFIFESSTSNCNNVSLAIVRKTSKYLIENLKDSGSHPYLDVQDVALIYRFDKK